jgi:hypothetical protein
MTTQRQAPITLLGILNADPASHVIKGRTLPSWTYDPLTDTLEDTFYREDDRRIHTADLLVDDRKGLGLGRCIHLVDHANGLAKFRKGDRIAVLGFLSNQVDSAQGEGLREFFLYRAKLVPIELRRPA